jgi:Capsule assembly protein Wzi
VFDCAYENSIYTAGYRFRGRSIGHATDNDTRMLSFGALYVTENGTSWSLKLRDAELNRDATSPETNHTIASVATDLQSVDLRYERELVGGRFMASAGAERRETVGTAEQSDEWRAAVEWVGNF